MMFTYFKGKVYLESVPQLFLQQALSFLSHVLQRNCNQEKNNCFTHVMDSDYTVK